ncbi:coiled-coil domain-containing protein 40-like [Planococcus citri]|uniref:coiled-coil domain-containing protein 40-like n=1 Tax=Planococcus citri TaxID=170843 RepID=UPI0031F7972D
MSVGSDYFSDYETQRSNEEEEVNVEESNEMNFEILHPENPLMIKFQKALKKLLETKIQEFRQENNALEYEIKAVKSETLNLTEVLYDHKAAIDKQKKSIEECNESVSTLILERQREEEELKREKEQLAKESAQLKEYERLTLELRTKLEVQSNLLHQLKEFEQKQAASLAVLSQLISKNRAEKKTKLTEKEKEDYLLLKLENEVFKVQMQIELYKTQIKTACSELVVLKETISERENEFQIESQDNANLLNIWKNLVDLVSKRDQKYSDFKKEFENKDIEYKAHQMELRNYEKNIEEEMSKNELLLSYKNRRKDALRAVRRKCHDMEQQKREFEEEIDKLTGMIECTEKTLRDTLEEQQNQERELDILLETIRKLNVEKYKLEESILLELQDEMVANKEASQLYDETKKIREEIKQKEIFLKEMQDEYHKNEEMLEIKKKELETSKMCVEDKKASIYSLEEEFSKNQKFLEHIKLEVKQHNCTLDIKQKELKRLEEKFASTELGDRIQQTKEDIEELSEKIEQKKKAWIRKQNEVLLLTEKNSRCINELNELRKNVSLFQQSVQRLENDIFKAEAESKRIDKSISFMFNRISKLNSEYSEKKRQEEMLDSENYISQNEVLEKLKESEQETLVTVEEIENLEKSKKSLEEKLLELQREDLEWEKKIKLANEMKRNIMQDESENGDIGTMKTEIHRMEIRYAQLKKAQESLVSDLESCVSKRDNIIGKNIAKEKNEKNAIKVEKTLSTKIRNLQNKISKMEKELKCRQDEYSTLEKENIHLMEKMKKAEMEIEDLQNADQEFDVKMKEALIQKQMNLEVLVAKQKFADFLYSVKAGKIKGFNQNEEVVQNNYLKHQSFNSDLCNVLESLCNDYPNLKYEIIPVLNMARTLSS